MKQGRNVSNRENQRAPRSSGFRKGADVAQRDQELCTETTVVRIKTAEVVRFSAGF